MSRILLDWFTPVCIIIHGVYLLISYIYADAPYDKTPLERLLRGPEAWTVLEKMVVGGVILVGLEIQQNLALFLCRT